MRKIKLIIQYDGTAYCGWQEQKNGISIQETVELALAKILGERVRVQAAGRTDAGVHALAMPAVFMTATPLPLKAFLDGLNSYLPPDIAVQVVEEVAENFRVIGDAAYKTYRYTILNSRLRSPLNHRTSWHIRSPLNLEAMREAAGYFVGEHDFATFRGQNCTAKTSIRRVDLVEIRQSGTLISIDVTGGGFLKQMVRIMVGTLVAVGQGRFEAARVKHLLQNPDRTKAGVTAPPQGLCLLEVCYNQHNAQ